MVNDDRDRMYELANLLVNKPHLYDEMELIDFGYELAELVQAEERSIGRMLNELATRGLVNAPDF